MQTELKNFTADPALSAISIGYQNPSYIADLILPRVTVPAWTFMYSYYELGENQQMVETLVDRRSRPNEVDWRGSTRSSFVEDHALDAPIPKRDQIIYSQSNLAPTDIEAKKTRQITDIILARRERATATLVTTAANYPVGNVVTLSGTSQWSDTTSDPVAAILDRFDTMRVRPNCAVFGQGVWSKLRRHPKVTAALFPSGGNAALAPSVVASAALAELFELQSVYIGQAYANTAAPGQTPTMARVWGNDALFFYKDANITDSEGSMTLGITAQWGGWVNGTIQDPDMGSRGGYRVRVGESRRELLLAPECGLLFKNVVA